MDMIITNGNLVTLDNNSPIAEAAGIHQGKIVMIGSSGDIMAHKGSKTEVIDLKGKTVVPGFNDSHVHLLNYGLSLQRLDCSNARSIDDIISLAQDKLKDESIPAGEWILGRGWNSVLLMLLLKKLLKGH